MRNPGAQQLHLAQLHQSQLLEQVGRLKHQLLRQVQQHQVQQQRHQAQQQHGQTRKQQSGNLGLAAEIN